MQKYIVLYDLIPTNCVTNTLMFHLLNEFAAEFHLKVNYQW